MTSGEGMPVTLEADQTAHFLPISPLGSALHCSHARSSPLLPPGKSHVAALGLPPCLGGLAGRQPEAGGAWGQAEPAWGCVAESQADHASPGPAPPHSPAYFQDQTALSWLMNRFNTKQQQIC